jgi:hypothetical protein
MKPLERHKRRWQNNIRIHLKQIGWRTWTGLIWLKQGQVAESCECGNEPSGTIKCWECLD